MGKSSKECQLVASIMAQHLNVMKETDEVQAKNKDKDDIITDRLEREELSASGGNAVHFQPHKVSLP